MIINTEANVKHATIKARILSADGTVIEDLGVIAEHKPSAYELVKWFIKGLAGRIRAKLDK